MNNMEELAERYEDTAFALMLNEYAEQKGNRLLQEFEDAQERFSAAEDEKCRKLIEKSFSKAHRRESFSRFFRTTCRVAAILFFVIGVCVTLTLSVEAIRTPAEKFLLDRYDRYSVFYFTDKSDTPKNPLVNDQAQEKYSVDQLMPEGYTLLKYIYTPRGCFIYIYINEAQVPLIFESFIDEHSPRFDTEDAEITPIIVRDHQGYLVEKGDVKHILWHQEDLGMVYFLSVQNVKADQIRLLAYHLAQAIDTGALEHPTQSYEATLD